MSDFPARRALLTLVIACGAISTRGCEHPEARPDTDAVPPPSVSSQAATQPAPAATESTRGENRSAWLLPDEAAAIAAALRLFGLAADEVPPVAAQIVTLDEDKTPFLHKLITNRPIWRVTLVGYRLRLKSAAPGETDPYDRTFDILVDPRDAKLLKIASRWPPGAPESAPEPRAEFAEDRMAEAGHEKFLGFPDTPPETTFLDALEAVYKGYQSPLVARQIVAHYVVRSSMFKEPQRVWSINLRGMPAFEASYPGVSVSARDHLRHIVEASAGKWLEGNTSPQPESPAERLMPIEESRRDALSDHPAGSGGKSAKGGPK